MIKLKISLGVSANCRIGLYLPESLVRQALQVLAQMKNLACGLSPPVPNVRSGGLYNPSRWQPFIQIVNQKS